MQKSTILELSRYNSKDKPSPAQWTTRLSKPTTITNGSIIQVRDSFIDCRLIDAQSIEISEDTNLSFQFLYWMQRNGIGNYTCFRDYPENEPSFQPVGGIKTTDYEVADVLDGVPFMLVDISPSNQNPNAQSYKPLIETANIFIPAGVYERSNLSDYITRQFQKINYQGPVKIDNIANPDSQTFSGGQVWQNYDANGNFLNFTKPQAPLPSENQLICTFQKQLYVGFWDGNGPAPEFIPNEMCLFYMDNQGRYRPCLLCPMTDTPNYSVPIYGMFAPCSNPSPPDNGAEIFAISYEGYNFLLWDAGMIGANDIQLTYNQENGNGKFAFDFMHNPLIDNESGNQQSGLWLHRTDPGGDPVPQWNRIAYINSASGIMFVNIYDQNTYDPNEIKEVPILNQMGFTINDLIPVQGLKSVFNEGNKIEFYYNSPPYNTFTYSDFKKYTTRNLISMGNIILNTPVQVSSQSNTTNENVYTIRTYGSAYAPYYSGFNLSDNNNTEPLTASSAPVSSLINSGHYLVEIQGYNNDYLDEDGYQLVKAIVSNYYFSENFASALEDSYLYVHYGENITLQNITVRILNPATKQLARNLGGNSSIYLQVINPIEPQSTKN